MEIENNATLEWIGIDVLDPSIGNGVRPIRSDHVEAVMYVVCCGRGVFPCSHVVSSQEIDD